MPKAKVRFGLVNYTRHDDASDRDYEDHAFRNMIIDIKDQGEYQRLKDQGAIVDADTELALPGRLAALPETASDEAILNWALAATPSEVEAAAAERPMLAARLLAAGEYAKERAAAWNEHLGGLTDAAERGAKAGEERRQRVAASTPAPVANALVPEPGAGLTGGQTGAVGGDTNATGTGAGSPLDAKIEGQQSAGGDGAREGGAAGDAGDETSTTDPDEKYDAVVKGNRDAVIKYISENPHEASAILDAENRRAARENEQPRVSVIRAVEVAAGHAS